jgi:N-methylhydantoinase A
VTAPTRDKTTTRLAVGIDIGGTFTDVVVADLETGERWSAKQLTSNERPSDAVVGALDAALAEAGAAPAQVQRVVHATTLATNLILERKGALVGYVTTEGFGDLLSLGHDRRGDDAKYDLRYVKQPPLVPRRRTVEVRERLGARGEVVVPLDEEQARAAIAALLEGEPGLEAVAVCLIHAHASPAHEQRVAELVRELRPGLHVTCSSDVWPEHRELTRANTAAVSAYVGPTIARYLHELEARLREHGVGARLQVMQSNGGTTGVPAVVRRPVQLVESGPAAGVIAAAHVGRRCGVGDLISFDMGGTTAKAGLVRGGEPTITTHFAVGGHASAGLKRIATGYPVKLPVIDLAEVGAGGGSIARVDAGGVLRVGPESAGSTPGPACYGLGVMSPTVTDCNLLLGYLDADHFLGGHMRVHPTLAEKAVREHLSDVLGLDPVDAAAGVYEIVNANMAAAIRVVTLERGIDPREFVLVASGGAGPTHVVRLAEAFDIPEVIVPPDAGVGSAIGLVVSDVVIDRVRTSLVDESAADPARVDAVFASLIEDAVGAVAAEGIAAERREVHREIDVRFRYQAHELPVPVPAGPVTATSLAAVAEGFRDAYFQLYGVRPSDPVEFVTTRLRVVGRAEEVPAAPVHRASVPPTAAGRRPVWFAEAGGFVDTPVYERGELAWGHSVEGPAMVQEASSSVPVPPGYVGVIDEWANLRVRLA